MPRFIAVIPTAVLCLLLVATTFSYGSYVSARNDAKRYDGQPACTVDAPIHQALNNEPCWIQDLQIVGRVPADDTASDGDYGLVLENAIGTPYTAMLASNDVAARTWQQSGAPTTVRVLFFKADPALIAAPAGVLETQANPDYRRAATWLRLLLFGAVSIVFTLCWGVVSLWPKRARQPRTQSILVSFNIKA